MYHQNNNTTAHSGKEGWRGYVNLLLLIMEAVMVPNKQTETKTKGCESHRAQRER